MSDAVILVGGDAAGPVLRLDEPLSLWGGLDPATGRIIDHHHPQFGESVTGRILVLGSGRGSSSGSSVLAEAVRAGVGPVGVILAEPDGILAVGGVVIAELYPQKRIPIVVAGAQALEGLATGDTVAISGGTIIIA